MRSYSRAFLLSLRAGDASQSRPQGLPVDVLAFPTKAKVISLPRPPPPPRPSEAADVWKPKRTVDGDVDDNARLFQTVRGVLNKVTPSKFEKLAAALRGLDMSTEARLAGVIELVFDKAVDEPVFAETYARLCHVLADKSAAAADAAAAAPTFHQLLLRACQREFERSDAAGADVSAEEAKRRRRSLGNVRLMGELFKVRMLTPAVLHRCVVRLLDAADEASLEALCRLLATAGEDVERCHRPNVDGYFRRLDATTSRRHTSNRLRFLVQDVVELRRNGWRPRRLHADEQPQTIQRLAKLQR